MAKRRGVKDTVNNRSILLGLGYSFTSCNKRNRIFIKASNGDFYIIKQLLDDENKKLRG